MRPFEAIRTGLVCVSLVAPLALAGLAQAQPAPEPPPAAPEDEPAPEAKPEEAPTPPPEESAPATADKETDCKNRIDDDGDSVVDCGDADCFEQPECRPSGQKEVTNALCSDWVDNDGDGKLDCDDLDCDNPAVSACKGSYPEHGAAVSKGTPGPEIPEGVTAESYIGKAGDVDGERNDELCSDGIDNDGDGRTDCADFGCRFDNDVHVCTGNPGLRFSVVASVGHTVILENTREDIEPNTHETAIRVLQLRAFGPIRGIDDSFFLLSMRAEKTPRLTFAMFQLPVGHKGHFFNVNSGGGGLSAALITSASKHVLLEPAYYVYSAFEQGNGAAAELSGPITNAYRVTFRAFGAGGSGRFSGNVGGRFFADDNTNYTWTGGGQLFFNLVGYVSRLDSQFIYTPVSPAFQIAAGAKYDQRAQERYPAANVATTLRYGRFLVTGEGFYKHELEFGSDQISYNVTVAALLVPRHLLLGLDYGAYLAGDLKDLPENLEEELGSEVQKQRDESQFRAALHWYAYQNIGIFTVRYKMRDVKDGRVKDDGFREQELLVAAGYRF